MDKVSLSEFRDARKHRQELYEQYKEAAKPGYQIAPQSSPEAEVNIKVTDPQLIAALHHAMQGYC